MIAVIVTVAAIVEGIAMMTETGDVIARDVEVAQEANLAEAALLTTLTPCRLFEEDVGSEVALLVAALNAASFVLVKNLT